MGRKMENVNKQSQEGLKELNEARGEGGRALGEVRSMAEIADSLPSDVDEEILDAAQLVREGARSEANSFMQSDVSSRVEAGRDAMDSANDQAGEQVERNRETIGAFRQMDGVSDFGKGARAEGVGRAETMIDQYQEIMETNTEQVNDTLDDFRRQVDEINDLLG